MLLSTLPDLRIAGKECDALGAVCAVVAPQTTRDMQDAFAELERQATNMLADAVINVQVIATPEMGQVVVTGTAVGLRDSHQGRMGPRRM
jgi:uncharacterized protein YbjQ (UPF0145 family)